MRTRHITETVASAVMLAVITYLVVMHMGFDDWYSFASGDLMGIIKDFLAGMAKAGKGGGF